MNDAYHNSSSTAVGSTEKRSGIETVEERDTDLRWCHSDIQVADGTTKMKKLCRIQSVFGHAEMETGARHDVYVVMETIENDTEPSG